MKITNHTTFRALPFRQIVTRLGNKLGRVTPRELRITICCREGKRCKHSTYLSVQLSNSSGVQHSGRREIDILFLWFPQDHSSITSRDVAYALDCMMRFEALRVPVRIQDRVSLVRQYAWADNFPLGEVAPPKPRPAQQPPSQLEKLKRRREKLKPLISKWKRARNAADYNVRKYEQEDRRLLLRIAKEEGREPNRKSKNH